jgi:uncharacterized membrane protein YidH (DUF202 family)
LWLLFIGILFLTGGLVFSCSAAQDRTRVPIALLLLFLGSGLLAWSRFRWQRMSRAVQQREQPAQVTKQGGLDD